MADVVTSQVYDGARNLTAKFTNLSDGTGESAVKKIDVTTLTPNPGTHLKIRRIRYTISGGKVRLQWDATSPIDIVVLSEGTDELDFSGVYAGGFPNNAGTGVTGSVLLTTVGWMVNSAYTIEIEAIKGV